MPLENSERERLAIEVAGKFYAVLLKYLPPSATLGELVVLTEVAKGVYLEQPKTVTEIHKSTGLSRWAVSRILLPHIETGTIKEKKDPLDSRRNLLVWAEEAFEGNRQWSREWLSVCEAAAEALGQVKS